METVGPSNAIEPGGASEHVFLGIMRVAEMFTRALSETLRPSRLTLSQYSVLRALRHGEAEGLRCRDVGERLVSRDPDITRLLDRLEARGFISRRREGADRRVVRAQITQQGLDLLESVDALVRDLYARYLGHFGQRELGTFASLLKATVEPS
jgi:DNA-binding MarR family transcriptional regulator